MSLRRRARIQSRLRIIALSSLMTLLLVQTLLLGVRKPSPVSGDAAQTNLQPPPLAQSVVRYGAVISRDLFAEERQPSARVLARAAAALQPTPTGSPTLLAIVTADAARVALIAMPGSTEPARAHAGDRLGIYHVIEIAPDAVLLEHNGITERLAMSSAGSQDQNLASAPTAPSGAGITATTQTAGPTREEAESVYRAYWLSRTSGQADPYPPNAPRPALAPKG